MALGSPTVALGSDLGRAAVAGRTAAGQRPAGTYDSRYTRHGTRHAGNTPAAASSKIHPIWNSSGDVTASLYRCMFGCRILPHAVGVYAQYKELTATTGIC